MQFLVVLSCTRCGRGAFGVVLVRPNGFCSIFLGPGPIGRVLGRIVLATLAFVVVPFVLLTPVAILLWGGGIPHLLRHCCFRTRLYRPVKVVEADPTTL